MRFQQRTHHTPQQVARDAAGLIAGWIAQDARAGEEVHVALAGGSTPAATYECLAARSIDWSGVHLWLGDERMVATDDADANARMARQHLLRPAGIDDSHLHLVPTRLPVDDAARIYGDEITRALPHDVAGVPRFSIVMLGLGEDGHVASLFPNARTLSGDDVCVAVTDAPKPPPLRISLSLGVINCARRRIIVTTGAGKAAALRAAAGPPDPTIPASLLVGHDTFVVVDDAAAGVDV